jgi:uncharacterized protein YcaQ
MSKYAALGDYLRQQDYQEVAMTFDEIERVTGTKLPEKAQNQPAWWSNNPSNNVMTKIWLAEGFRTERVNIAARRLVFRRVQDKQESASSTSERADGDPIVRHPAFGAMKGLVRIMPGTDLTEPADPSWGESLDKAE